MKTGSRLILTAIFGLSAGFALGILTLFAANVPIESWLKGSGAGQTAVNAVMVVVICLWAVATGLLTLVFHKRSFKTDGRPWPAIPVTVMSALIAVVALVVLVIFPAGAWMPGKSSGRLNKDRFAFGAYPGKEQLKKLKDDGYSGVISLLSPTIPFENVLLRDEKAAATREGLKFYSVPMLPWITENRESLERLKRLVKVTKGKYYIHCYLGRHRVDLAKTVIEGELETIALEEALIFPDDLERGPLYTYGVGDKLLGPYPTDEEWFNTILRGRVKQVVSYLDPDNPEDRPLIDKERGICRDMDMRFVNIPVKDQPGIWPGLDSLQAFIQTAQAKTFIHGFKDDERFRQLDAWMGPGQEHGVSPEAIPKKLGGQTAFFITRRISVGRAPSDTELKRLAESGIISVLFLVENNDTEGAIAKRVKNGCRKAGLSFVKVEFDKDYVSDIAREVIKDGNPCFVLTPDGAQYQVEHDLKAAILH